MVMRLIEDFIGILYLYIIKALDKVSHNPSVSKMAKSGLNERAGLRDD